MNDTPTHADVIDLLAALEPNRPVARLSLSNEGARRATRPDSMPKGRVRPGAAA